MDTTKTGAAAARKRGFSFYQRLFFLYFLNLVDWLCTEALLASGRFYEANPIMNPVIGNFSSALCFKGLLPLALVIACAVVFKLAQIEESRLANVLLNIGIIAYSLVNLWHILNFLLLFSA